MLLVCIESDDKALDDVAHPLLVNRLLATRSLDEDGTFATRCCRHVGAKVSFVMFENSAI